MVPVNIKNQLFMCIVKETDDASSTIVRLQLKWDVNMQHPFNGQERLERIEEPKNLRSHLWHAIGISQNLP